MHVSINAYREIIYSSQKKQTNTCQENYDHLLCKILFRHFLHNLRWIATESVIPAWQGTNVQISAELQSAKPFDEFPMESKDIMTPTGRRGNCTFKLYPNALKMNI
jgi:hypothetical protein